MRYDNSDSITRYVVVVGIVVLLILSIMKMAGNAEVPVTDVPDMAHGFMATTTNMNTVYWQVIDGNFEYLADMNVGATPLVSTPSWYILTEGVTYRNMAQRASYTDKTGYSVDWMNLNNSCIHRNNIYDSNVTQAKLSTKTDTYGAAVHQENIAIRAVDSDEIALDAILAIHVDDDAIEFAAMADNAIGTAEIQARAVEGSKIALDAILAEHVDDNAIVNAAMADNSVDNSNLDDDAVDSAEIAADAILAEHIDDLAVEHVALAADAVDSGNIVDTSVRLADLNLIQMYLVINQAGAHSIDAGRSMYDTSWGTPTLLDVGVGITQITYGGTFSEPPAIVAMANNAAIAGLNPLIYQAYLVSVTSATVLSEIPDGTDTDSVYMVYITGRR